MTRRALVVGGSGFIGSHLVDRLRQGGWRVAVLDLAHERYREPNADVEYFLGSFFDPGLLRAALDGVEVVFHLASSTIPETSNNEPGRDVQENLAGTLALLEACVERRVARFVFASSGGTVYGIPQELPVREGHPTDPICSYGIVKLAIEKYLHLFHKLHGLRYAVVRPANPFGPRQDPGGRQGAIAVFLQRVLAGEPITIWGDGEVERDFFYVTDLAAGLTAAAESEEPHGIYNLGSGCGTSLNRVLETVRSVIGRPFEVRRLPVRQFDVPRIYLDTGRARSDLGWLPAVSFEEGIVQTWRWMTGLGRNADPS